MPINETALSDAPADTGITVRPDIPQAGSMYREGESSIRLFPVQAALMVLTRMYPDTGSLDVTGVNDENTAETVRIYQRIFGQDVTGEIDAEFLDYLTALYRCSVSAGRYRPVRAL